MQWSLRQLPADPRRRHLQGGVSWFWDIMIVWFNVFGCSLKFVFIEFYIIISGAQVHGNASSSSTNALPPRFAAEDSSGDKSNSPGDDDVDAKKEKKEKKPKAKAKAKDSAKEKKKVKPSKKEPEEDEPPQDDDRNPLDDGDEEDDGDDGAPDGSQRAPKKTKKGEKVPPTMKKPSSSKQVKKKPSIAADAVEEEGSCQSWNWQKTCSK